MSSVNELLKLCKIDWDNRDPADRLEQMPNGEVVHYRDPSHRYHWLTPEGKIPLTSVTSILRVLDKPQLLYWVERVTREGLNWRDVRDDAGTLGTSVHAAADALATTGEVPDLEAFPAEDRGPVRALAAWWIATEPEPIATEVIVASFEHRYSGRFDLLANIGGRRCLCDFKTSKAVYPVEMFMQLAAYDYAAQEVGHPPTDCQMIVRLAKDGSFEVAESCATAADFLGVKAAFDAKRRVEKAHKELLAA